MNTTFDDVPGVDQTFPEPVAEEVSRFIDTDDEQIYLVVHYPRNTPRAQIVFCPPFGMERTYAYTTLVRLSRALAYVGFQVVRFDYRSFGESSGCTQELGISDWIADAEEVWDCTGELGWGIPRILIGLRFGAFVAATLFAGGKGAALLSLDPPERIRMMLVNLLRRKIAEDLMARGGNKKRRDSASYIAELEREGVLEVEGYLWGTKMWRESEYASFPIPAEDDSRPVLVIHLDKRPPHRVMIPGKSEVIPVSIPPFWGLDRFILGDHSALFNRVISFACHVSEAGCGKDACRPAKSAAPSKMKHSPHKSSQGIIREVFSEDIDGHRYVFTSHRANGEANEPALVLFNGGQVPRNGHGDLNTKVADAVAERGITSYRVDLPGLGDSPGSLPRRMVTFWEENTEGRQEPYATSFLKYIQAKHRHYPILAGGLCGAAHNAIYSASRNKGLINGIIMWEIGLRMREIGPRKDALADKALETSNLTTSEEESFRFFRRVLSKWAWIRLLVGDSRYSNKLPFLQSHYDSLRSYFVSKLLINKTLDQYINVPLAKAFFDVCNSGIPVLSISEEDSITHLFIQRITTTIFGERQRRMLADLTVRDSNHVFTSGRAIEKSIGYIQTWLPEIDGIRIRQR